jgi:hypothetical protein
MIDNACACKAVTQYSILRALANDGIIDADEFAMRTDQA